MKYTEEQDQVRSAGADLRSGTSLKVLALAGSGKTTTLKGVALARRDRGMYLAFNKDIAAEARQKLAATKCRASTMHGLALRTFRDLGITDKPADVNVRSVIDSRILERFHIPDVKGWGDFRFASGVMRTMKAFADSADQEFDPAHARAALMDSLGDPDFMPNMEKADFIRTQIDTLADTMTEVAQNYWVKLMEEGQYNFDMLLKIVDLDEDLRREAFGRFRYLMVDEAQDINPVQRSIVTKTGLPLIAVGDPYQQIYSWRGAENALAQLPGKELYLTRSFRFGDNIAAVARHILSAIPDDGGPDERLIGAGPGKVEGAMTGAVICRTNIGMLDEAIKYLNKGHKVYVDNIEALQSDVRSAQALREGRMNDVKCEELKPFDSWDELEMAAEEGNDPGLSKLVNLVRQNRIADVNRLASQKAATPDEAPLSIITGHRSKGLEYHAVQLGGDWPDIDTMASRYKAAKLKSAKHVTLAQEAYNTLYVATTRAKLRISGYGRILQPEREPERVAPMTQEEAARSYAGDGRGSMEPG